MKTYSRDVDKARRAKKVEVNLGRKGSFTINHPGAFKAFAAKKGLSTAEAAEQYKDAPGHVGRMARSALGLMAMGK